MAILYAFFALLKTIATPLIITVILALGFGIATYSGTQLVLDELLLGSQDALGEVLSHSQPVADTIRVIRLDQALSIIIGAIAARFAAAGVQAGMKWGWIFGATSAE